MTAILQTAIRPYMKVKKVSVIGNRLYVRVCVCMGMSMMWLKKLLNAATFGDSMRRKNTKKLSRYIDKLYRKDSSDF